MTFCVHRVLRYSPKMAQYSAERGNPKCKKKKVKCSGYRPGVSQRVGRGITLLSHDRGTRRGWVISSTPRPHFTPGKDPVPISHEAGWAPRPVWTGRKSRPHPDSIPDRPGRSQSLYRLSYPAHKRELYLNEYWCPDPDQLTFTYLHIKLQDITLQNPVSWRWQAWESESRDFTKLDDRSVNRVQWTKTKNQCMHFKTAKHFPRVVTDNLTSVLCQQRPTLTERIPTRTVRGSCSLKIMDP